MSSSELEGSLDQRIVIEGVANNAKVGAVVITDDEEVVYVAQMKAWPGDVAGKRVVVDGVLHRGQVYPDVEEENGITSQGLPGEQWFLEVENYRLA
ncbi:MAG: hypothetical protein ACRD8U_11040 [Pyrinomonadaceae bacterium]